MDSLFWLALNVISIIVLAFFSMEEMALVSLNKIRLQYFLTKGNRRAKWLHYLLSHPSRLFGTTLIGVNVSMMLGSEFAREFHTAIGIDPDLAPLSQVFLVIIFGELAPQFAARRFSEHVAFIGAPILYVSARVMAPFVYILGVISKLANRLLGGKETHHDLFLTLEELQKVLEEKEDERPYEKSEELDKIIANIFRLRTLTAKNTMVPISLARAVPSHTRVDQLRRTLKKAEPYIAIYHKDPSHIVGIAFIRDIVKAAGNRRLRDFASSPWFITENTPLNTILNQFRTNKQMVGCVIDQKGQTIGVLSLDNILEFIFGRPSPVASPELLIEVTVPGDMEIAAFNKEYNVNIQETGCLTLEDIFLKKFEEHPEEGETLVFPPYELIVKECSLMDIKTIQVRTRT
ncbi:MAG: HlyC/CorC family transporter [Chlamydiia bacterium]|nr:HlyC/CorC family transporter [Chlamydiia bacterium]